MAQSNRTPATSANVNVLASANRRGGSLWDRLFRLVPGNFVPGNVVPGDVVPGNDAAQPSESHEAESSAVDGSLAALLRPEGFTPGADADRTAWLYQLSPEGRAFRERVKSLLGLPEFAPREGLTAREQAELSYSRFKRVREALDLRVRDVEERPARLAAALELIGAVDGTLFTVMSIHYCLCGGSLLRHGAGVPEIEKFIDELDSLESVGTFLVTELGYGNNVVSLQTRADFDIERGEVVLSTPNAKARKFMPNTGLDGVAKIAIVMARLFVKGEDHGVFPVLVRLRTSQGTCSGVSITPLGDKPSYALDNAMTTFNGVRVPRHNLLLGAHSTLNESGEFLSDMKSRRERFLLSMEQVQLGRLCLSAVGATLAGASAFVAIKYAEQRKTFAPRQEDVSVLEYKNHQRDVFGALAYAYASRTMVNYAVEKFESSSDREHDYSFRITSATKAHVSYATERYVRLCRERCGAAALFEENRMSTYASQCMGLVTAEGDNHIVLIKIARQMLLGQGYTRLGKQARSSAKLTDPQRLLTLLRERERRLLSELRSAMAPAKLPGVNLFKLWNENINLALEAATAHGSRLAAEAFWARIEKLGADPAVDLFRLFALSEIAPHMGFYLVEDLVTKDEAKKLGRSMDRVCEALRPYALELATAIDVPNSLLRAPLASDDYVAVYDGRARRHERGKQDSGEFLIGADGTLEPISRVSVSREAFERAVNE